MIQIVHKKNSNDIDNVPLINIKNKMKCSDIVQKRIDENTSKDFAPRNDNLKHKTNYDRISKREGDQKTLQRADDRVLPDADNQGIFQMAQDQMALQRAEVQESLQRAEVQVKLQRAEDQGTLQREEIHERLQSAEDRVTLQRAKETGTLQRAEVKEALQRAEARGTLQGAEVQGLMQRTEVQVPLQMAEGQEMMQRTEGQGTMQRGEIHETFQRAEDQKTLQRAEEKGTLQRAESQEAMQRPEDQVTLQRAVAQGTSQGAEVQGLMQRTEGQGLMQRTEGQEMMQRAEDQKFQNRGKLKRLRTETEIQVKNCMNSVNDDNNEQSSNDKNINIFEHETCDDMADTFASPTIDVFMPLFENDISLDFTDLEDQYVYEICRTCYETPENEVNSTSAESFETTDTSNTQKETDIGKTQEKTDTSLTELSEGQTDSHDEDIQYRQPRRRRKNVEKWKQTIRRRRRNAGENYVSSRDQNVPRKTIKPISCKCKFKCSERLNEEDQSLIFTKFWQLDYEKQRSYIKENVIKTDKRRKTTTTESRRKNTLQYFFTYQCGSRVQVCKKNFLCTLGIGERTVQYTLERQGNNSMTDRRGRKKGYSKFSQEDKEYIRENIRSFPTVSSHYCRKNTQRRYLSKDLSIAKMYELYQEN